MRIWVEIDLLVIGVAELLKRLFTGAGPRDGCAENSDNRGALRPTKAGVATGDHIGSDAALPVRRPRERDEAPFTGDEVPHLDGIADGEDIRIARSHVLIHADAAALADFESGRFRETDLRANAKRKDHKVRRMHLAGLRLHLQ